MGEPNGTCRLISVTLDKASIGRAAHAVEHERAVAIYDLVEENSFAVDGCPGPYHLVIGLAENRLMLDVRSDAGEPVLTHGIALGAFRRVVKDYFLVCESYHEAIRSGSPSRIEAIDMGRRGLHDEAADLLLQRLDGKLELDFDTARRVFTLIFALHWKG